MSTDSDSSSAEPDDLPSSEEFEQWLREDPANMKTWIDLLARLETGDFGPLPPALEGSYRTTLALQRADEAFDDCRREMGAFHLAKLDPDEVHVFAERIDAWEERLNTAVDGLLDISEPMRTRNIQRLVALIDDLREIRTLLKPLI